MECLTQKLRQEIVKNEEKLEAIRVATRKEPREKGEKVEEQDGEKLLRVATEESYVASIGEKNIVTLTNALKEYNEAKDQLHERPEATFPMFIATDANKEIGVVDILVENEETKERQVEEDELQDPPDEVMVIDIAEMEWQAEHLIPHLNATSGTDVEVVDDDDQRSVRFDDTTELVAKLQEHSRQVVAFNDLVDCNATVDNEDSAEEDEYMLEVLKDKDTFNVLSTQAPPFGVVAEEINDEIKENSKQKAQPAKQSVSDNVDGNANATKKQRTKVVREDEHVKVAKAKQASGRGKARTTKQMIASATKKTVSKAKSTPSKVPAKQTLTTTTKKTSGAKQSGGGMRKSPTHWAKETGK
ncbi:hypothetical protein ACA910_010979 [Epithemia clementina (nom. ined.)]